MAMSYILLHRLQYLEKAPNLVIFVEKAYTFYLANKIVVFHGSQRVRFSPLFTTRKLAAYSKHKRPQSIVVDRESSTECKKGLDLRDSFFRF